MQERKQSLIFVESIPCCQDKHSIFICTTENCKQTAFMCNDQNCQCIKSKHYQCNSNGMKYLLESIQKQKQLLNDQNHKSIDAVIEIYDKMIEKLSQDRQNFIETMDMFGLGDNMRKFITLINEGKSNQIDGDLAYKIKLEMGKKMVHKYNIDDENTIRKRWQLELSKFEELRNKVSNAYKIGQLNSKILDVLGEQKIKNWLPKQALKFQLLYRGSQNDFKASAFHQKCDGVQDTIVVVQTEFGKIFGGYTPVKWQFPHKDKYIPDPSGNSFLFSVSLGEKYELKDKNKAIRVYPQHFGPLFGQWTSFALYNQCNLTKNSWIYPDNSYNYLTHSNNQQSFKALSGQTSGHQFKVNEYQVFKVIWR